MIYWISMFFIWLFMTIFFPTRVIGKKNLCTKKCIWASNHTTNFDGFLVGTKAFCRFYSLAKIELFKHKLLGAYLKKLGCVPVHRGASDITAIKSCLRILNEKNRPLLIFPQGTRESTPEEVQNLKNGVAMFALKTKAPIIPIVIVRKPVIFRPNRVVVGEPIYPSDYENGKPTKEIYEEINIRLSSQMSEMLEKYSYKKRKNKVRAN